MPNHRTVFNHVGLCVTDRDRSRRFYEGLLGFQFWWDLDLPDEGTAALLQLDGPIGVRATYLVRDGFVLELIDYSKREVDGGAAAGDGRGGTDPHVVVGIRPGGRVGAGRGLRWSCHQGGRRASTSR